MIYNLSKLNIDILVTIVLIGKTVKAVTAPATVKGDKALCHCAYAWEGELKMNLKSGDLPKYAFVDFREDYLK
mgnify:FL=1